jgi:hypothetical protein
MRLAPAPQWPFWMLAGGALALLVLLAAIGIVLMLGQKRTGR